MIQSLPPLVPWALSQRHSASNEAFSAAHILRSRSVHVAPKRRASPIITHWPLVSASIRRSRESTTCTALSFCSVWITATIHPCTLRNIGRLFQPNASSSKARQFLRRIRGNGRPLKMLTSTVQILIASARTFCDQTRAMSSAVAGLVLQIASSYHNETSWILQLVGSKRIGRISAPTGRQSKERLGATRAGCCTLGTRPGAKVL